MKHASEEEEEEDVTLKTRSLQVTCLPTLAEDLIKPGEEAERKGGKGEKPLSKGRGELVENQRSTVAVVFSWPAMNAL